MWYVYEYMVCVWCMVWGVWYTVYGVGGMVCVWCVYDVRGEGGIHVVVVGRVYGMCLCVCGVQV